MNRAPCLSRPLGLHPLRRSAALTTLVALLATLSLAPSLTGCGPGNVIAKNKSIADVDDQTTTCKVAKDPLNPMIVEWPATSKVNLDRASKSGIVVVSYVGCTLKVLQGCSAKGSYAYTGVTPARDKIDIGSEDELYARLPLGAISLKGELAQGSTLRLDYIAVGQRVAADAPKGLEGACEGATHYVRTITLGAYSLDRNATAKAGGGIDINGAGIGGERHEGDNRINGSGDVTKCASGSPSTEDGAEKAGCGAPLQLDLAPLQMSDGAVIAAGFGEGLGTLSTGPSDVGNLDAVGATSLKDVDADYLQLLQNAKRADQNKVMKPLDKANAWGALAEYKGKNPTKDLASERRDAWEKQAADLDKLKDQYLSDKSKLDKLVALDEDIVSKEKKAAYKKEFAEVYTPWEPQLEMALGEPVNAGDTTATPTKLGDDEMGDFYLQAEGGLDVQQLDYNATDANSNTIGDPTLKTTGSTPSPQPFQGKAGSFGGFAGLVLTLPKIPIPGWGLSAIARYAFANEVNRITTDIGIKFMAKGFAGGAYIGYAKLLNVKNSGAGCDAAATTPTCLAQDQEIVDNSNGGFDARVDIGYQFLIGKLLTLHIGGGLGYALFPYSVTGKGLQGTTMGKTVMTSDLAKGVSATLQAGIGLRL